MAGTMHRHAASHAHAAHSTGGTTTSCRTSGGASCATARTRTDGNAADVGLQRHWATTAPAAAGATTRTATGSAASGRRRAQRGVVEHRQIGRRTASEVR